MKFSPLSWNEVKPNEKIEAPKGWLRLRLSAPCSLYVEAQGYEALAGFGTSFDLELSEAVTFRASGPKDTRVFHYEADDTTFRPNSEVYTNIDRMPDESGNLLEVRQGMRQLELMRRAVLRDIRAARDASLPEKAKDTEAVIEPPAEPAAAPAAAKEASA